MLGAKAAVVARSENKVAAFRTSVGDIAERLEERQRRLDRIVSRYFGKIEKQSTKTPIAMKALPEATRLADNRKAADRFCGGAERGSRPNWSDKAEIALRKFGLNPTSVAQSVPEGVGGPLIPLSGGEGALIQLGQTLNPARLAWSASSSRCHRPSRQCRSYSVAPSGSDPIPSPTAPPYTPAWIFADPLPSPIYAAAAGRVIRVGPWSGYGNVVVIDHGHGIETRYGHLSGFTVRPHRDALWSLVGFHRSARPDGESRSAGCADGLDRAIDRQPSPFRSADQRACGESVAIPGGFKRCSRNQSRGRTPPCRYQARLRARPSP